jgi:hypothetical protein
MCGARKMVRQQIAERIPGRKAPIVVEVDVCENCGERYYDLDAMHALEAAARSRPSRRAV